MPRLVNMRDHGNQCPPGAMRIDRKTPHGNPFVIGRDGDREMVCDRFEAEVLPGLDVEMLRNRDLACWCEPARCHGEGIFLKLYGTRTP